MKTLYIDCGMGAAGDMLTAALLELMPDPDAFIAELNSLGIPGVEFVREPSVKCGITGTHVSVKVNGEEEEAEDVHDHEHAHSHEHSHEHEHDHDHEHTHTDAAEAAPEHHHEHDHEHSHEHAHDHGHTHSHSHSGLHDIEHIVRGHLHIPEAVKDDVMAVYGLIAEAESHAHGQPVDQIHFHEVGSMDAVADVTAVCLLMNRIAPDQVIASPVHVGSGHVRAAHGVLPVPAPATAFILKDVPIYGGRIQGELCTPTGAALLKHFADRFGDMPAMKVRGIGYGMGKKDFEAANCVRVMLGDSSDGAADTVYELSCNVDDMSAERLSFAVERLLEAGALDVFTQPIGMKKSRPGVMVTVLCRPEDRERLASMMFKYISTIGIREVRKERYVLRRSVERVDTPYGKISRKDSFGYGVSRSKYEYEDLARIARENELSIDEVIDEIEKK
ncbi:MAG: nickel pincer cofactor biosynthesis protein LarC [Firmicutes bacterium]|nr:nickel pincer cofactor biosynthesis protein LarC [Bacillota bacterium]